MPDDQSSKVRTIAEDTANVVYSIYTERLKTKENYIPGDSITI